MWARQTTIEAMNDDLEHGPRTVITMEKNRQEGLFEAVWTTQTQDGKGAFATEEADSIALLDASPLGSELSSLPPLDLTHHRLLSSLDMSFLDPEMGHLSAAGSSSQPPTGQFDSALEEYTQTWRRLVHESSILASSLFQHDQPHPAFSIDADPTPPLAFDFDIPATMAGAGESYEYSPAASSVQLVAPRPVRLANPAIHLAALVEDHENPASFTFSQPDGDDSAENAEGSDVAGGTFDVNTRLYGYSMEQLLEYMSDSESSCDESEPDYLQQEEVADTTPSLADFQFIYPTNHELANSSTAQNYTTLSLSPLSPPLPPPASPLSPLSPTIPQISRSSQLRETMRQRRAARHGHLHIGQGHSRHSSVPNFHYRPPGWNEAVHSEAFRRHRENASHSVDWSTGVMIYSPSEHYQQMEQYPAPCATNMQYSYPLAERTYQ